MHEGRLVFAQLMDFIPKRDFDECVRRYRGNYRVRDFSCRDQFLAMAFAQLTYRENLRDIETCLNAVPSRLYHAGFRGRVSKRHAERHQQASRLADPMPTTRRSAYSPRAALVRQRTTLPSRHEADRVRLGFHHHRSVSCGFVSLGTVSPVRKGTVKLHTLIDLRGNILCFIRITRGKRVTMSPFSIICRSARAAFYTDGQRYLRRFLASCIASLVRWRFSSRDARRTSTAIAASPAKVDKSTGLRSDQTIVLRGVKTSKLYPDALRRIAYYDAEHDRRLLFLTNNFELPLLTMAHALSLAAGRSNCSFKVDQTEPADQGVLWQHGQRHDEDPGLDRRVCVYVLVAILRKRLKLDRSLSGNSANPQCHSFRENPYFSGTFRDSHPKSRR